MDNIAKKIGMFVLAALVISAFAVIGAYPTKWIVNYLFTPHVINSLFGVDQLNFWRALLLNWICAALFKSIEIKS